MKLIQYLSNIPIFTKRILVFLLIGLFFVSVLEIWLVNRLSTYGEQISKLERLSEDVKVENRVLKNKIDSYSALENIEIQANKIGFVPVKNITYIKPVDVAYSSPN